MLRLEIELRALARVTPSAPHAADEGDKLVQALERRLLDADRGADRVQLQGETWAAEDAGKPLGGCPGTRRRVRGRAVSGGTQDPPGSRNGSRAVITRNCLPGTVV